MTGRVCRVGPVTWTSGYSPFSRAFSIAFSMTFLDEVAPDTASTFKLCAAMTRSVIASAP